VVLGAIGFALLMSLLIGVFKFNLALIHAPIPLALLLIPLMTWCALLLLQPDQPREWQYVLALMAFTFALSLGVEIVVLDGDIGRQNTFFKFYMQVWVMLSVVCAAGLAWLLAGARRWGGTARATWLTALVLLLAISGVYPIFAVAGKNAMRMAPNAPATLDGDAYMNFATYYYGSAAVPMADDLAMIEWLQDNVQGTPVILEAYQYPSEYQWGGRIAINTGLPTLLGWRFHQTQQRTLDPLPSFVDQRGANVFAMYNLTDIPVVWRMLRFYKVQYIVVAKLERATYQAEGLAKFAQMAEMGLLEAKYEQNGDTIYRVLPGATLPPVIVGAAPTTFPVNLNQ
jgi:uncharacterized membrane protein